MKIKGTSVLSTLNFVKTKFPAETHKWLESLPEISKKIFTMPIYAGQWFPFIEGMIMPTQKIGEILYGGDTKKAAYETGKFSAEQGLKGVYKIFVKVASTGFVIKKTSQIFNTYYEGASIEIIDQTDKKVTFKVKGIDIQGRLFFERLSGWMEKTIEIVNNKPIAVSYKEEEKENNLIDAYIEAKWE